ncbi:Uncharacterised protein [Mycobacteroides abscessus subsp. abscessus]|nr:Uncharacterised protein [Mycobacteroides abscessus subsp. abscessus]
MAVATPAILPVPMREAALMLKAWNEEIPLLPSAETIDLSPRILNISLKYLSCTNLVLKLKYNPSRIKPAIKIYVHTKSFTRPTYSWNSFTKVSIRFPLGCLSENCYLKIVTPLNLSEVLLADKMKMLSCPC